MNERRGARARRAGTKANEAQMEERLDAAEAQSCFSSNFHPSLSSEAEDTSTRTCRKSLVDVELCTSAHTERRRDKHVKFTDSAGQRRSGSRPLEASASMRRPGRL